MHITAFNYKCYSKYQHFKSLLKNRLQGSAYSRNYSTVKPEKTVIHFNNGRSLELETGRWARMASGSVMARMGETAVLVACSSKPSSTVGQSFLPLTVDYTHKSAAVSTIPKNFLKRDLGISEKEILTGRIIDRSVRPLFPPGFLQDTKITCNLQAADHVYSPDVISINAASAALAVSSIPWGGPVGAVRVGLCDDEVLVNPTLRELQHSAIDLVVTAGPGKTIVMLEGGCNNVQLPKLQQAISTGVSESQAVVRAIKKLAERIGKPKTPFQPYTIPEEVLLAVQEECVGPLVALFSDYSHDKQSRDLAVTALRSHALDSLSPRFPDQAQDLEAAFQQVFKSTFRQLILDSGIRCDGRSCSDLRDISCQADVFPSLHGSSLFQRGQTQVQCSVAYGPLHSNSPVNPLLQATGAVKGNNFLLHYHFPSYATDEVGKSGALSRREVGHGALAEKALRPLLPADLPFTVMLTANVLESNGSSSMGTVCGGTMALLDAGVKLSHPAAGIAIGLVTDTDPDTGKINNYRVLTDILGIEDYLGDMDFKIAGTKTGITAIQADIKLQGLPVALAIEALQAATKPRLQVLKLMQAEISAARDHKDSWPVVTSLEVPPSRRARLVGPGGTTLKNLQAQTRVEIWFEEESRITVFAPDRQAHEAAKDLLDHLLQDKEPTLEFGAIYSAKVTELKTMGVMVQLYEDMAPVLLHNSQLDVRKVQHPSALGIEVGESIKVKYFGRDPISGQMRLSRRAIQAASQVTRNLHKTGEDVPPSPAAGAGAAGAGAAYAGAAYAGKTSAAIMSETLTTPAAQSASSNCDDTLESQ